jgi:hypothetical protein
MLSTHALSGTTTHWPGAESLRVYLYINLQFCPTPLAENSQWKSKLEKTERLIADASRQSYMSTHKTVGHIRVQLRSITGHMK